MVAAVRAVQRFMPLLDYVKQREMERGAQAPERNVVRVAQMDPLPSSTHVVISEEGRRRLAVCAIARPDGTVSDWVWDQV